MPKSNQLEILLKRICIATHIVPLNATKADGRVAKYSVCIRYISAYVM